MSVPNSKGPRWAPRSGDAKRPRPTAARQYPALELWRAAHARGVRLHCTDPLERAACHEANAAEYDALANRAASIGEAVTWRRIADEEMAESISILAEAERRARAAKTRRRD